MTALFDYDLELDAACGFAETFTWYQQGAVVIDGAVASGTPMDLSGASSAQLMIRQNATDASPLVSISTTPNASGSILLGGSAGTIAVSIKAAALAAFAGGLQARYDLLVFWSSGASPTKVLSGAAFIGQTFTR